MYVRFMIFWTANRLRGAKLGLWVHPSHSPYTVSVNVNLIGPGI